VCLQCLTINLYISIVFVHGLSGGYETWEKDDVFWPRDLLPKVLPEVRVILFGHDAGLIEFFAASEPTRGVDYISEDLLEQLTEFRRRSNTVRA
jgi:hypothetical protein